MIPGKTVGKTVGKLKDRIMNMMKIYALAKIIVTKIDLGLKIYTAAIQTKIFFVLLSILAISKIKFLMDLKKSPEPSKSVYYEHAQHDHHYDGDGWGHSGEGGGLWGR
ncbi:hypothetical protein JTB14_026416 [Gonioctena quinquepunctata]|nr:hypothetical protein JTB14_026416 [Gonioctena quinquepunctata]